MNSPFNNTKIRDWFFGEIEVFDLGVEDVVTLGSGSFEEYDFDGFLRGHGFNVCAPSKTIEILIVGGEEFDEAAVLNVLKLRAGKTLRVYTQEMFLSYLASGTDPLNSEIEIHNHYAQGHSAIEFLLSIRFKFPSTDISGWSESRGPGKIQRKRSMLNRFGYKVGKRGMNELDRQNVISLVFKGDLIADNEFNQEYIDEWGKHETPLRLLKIVNLLTVLCLNAKRRSNGDMSIAIDAYESDLKWIKKSIYKPYGFQFSWPGIDL